MKKQRLKIIFLCGVIAVCLSAFAGLGWIYLVNNKDAANTAESADKMPYSSVPGSVTVKYVFSDRSSALLYLEFSAGRLTAVIGADENAGYDYELQPLSGTAAGFIDRLGGIEIMFDNKILRYTGSQTVKLLSENAVGKKEIMEAVFNRIASQGITRGQLTFLLQNSKTGLTIPLCYSWPEWLKDLCANADIEDNTEEVFQ